METNFNTTVTDWRGKTLGYRCLQCGSIVQAMWGNLCNQCREDERRHQELIKAIRERQSTTERVR